jgi:serum/glucocorticoid-regulated kinase 2
MYRKILQEPLTFPSSDIVPPAARDLLTRLLDRDPQRRLGANGAVEIKSHHFFANIDWRKLLQRKYEPSFRPNVVCHDFPYPFLLILQILIRLAFTAGCS